MKQICEKELLLRIAKKIKELRERKKVSQIDFYIDTQIHIARIETAKVNVTVSTLSAICRYFDISLSEFFEDL